MSSALVELRRETPDRDNKERWNAAATQCNEIRYVSPGSVIKSSRTTLQITLLSLISEWLPSFTHFVS